MEDFKKLNSQDANIDSFNIINGKLNLFDLQIHEIIEFSEREFIVIGEKLQNFHSEAKEITLLSSSLTNSMSGEVIGKSIAELQDMLLRINNYLAGIKDKFESGKNKLEIVCRILNEISEKTTYFQYIVKHLRILGISTKIESARLGADEQGFNTLADNVDNLSEKITDKSHSIREKVISLIKSASQVRHTILNLSGLEHENSNTIITNSKKSLDSLISQYKLSSSQVSKLSTHSEKISKDIGQIVISIQYHDITKQQLEHVRDAFKELNSNSKKTSKKSGRGNASNEYLKVVHNACRLQNAQLIHSKDDLCQATEKMLSSLSNIGNNVSGIYSELSGLFEEGNLKQNSVLNEIERNLISVSETLTKNSEVEGRLVLSIGTVAKTINELSSYVDEIGSIGTEIELIALNGSIKAARTGEDGAPMGIIAESIQKLSKEAKEQTANIVETLSKVTVIANELYNELAIGTGNNSDTELNVMTENISTLLKLISKYDIENKTSLGKIKNKVKQLFTNIENTANSVKIHSKFKEFVEGLSSELVKIMQDTNPGENMTDRSERLDHFQDKYTMKSERDIYNKIVILPDSKPTEPNNDENTSSGKNGLGDNVELF